MKMNVFEYTVAAKHEEIASFENLDHAKAFARHIANEEHCDVDIINAFTGEVHLSLVCYAYVAYNPLKDKTVTFYKVKEREW
jgi:hypothetical protein